MKAEWVKLSQIKKMEKSAFENNYESNRFFLWHVEYLKGKEGQQFFILFFLFICFCFLFGLSCMSFMAKMMRQFLSP